jgi:hypothetical protein
VKERKKDLTNHYRWVRLGLARSGSRVLSPEICMAACMVAPAGRPAVIPSHRMEDYCAVTAWRIIARKKTAHLAQNLEVY